MKYYIPTSSLNFNNILSTESISPKCFYELRGFGYSRWFCVNENNFENVTLLYDTPYAFYRPKSDLEDHAMLVEIDTEDSFPKLKDGIYYTDETIYFNPWQTKFYFFSDRVKNIVLSLSESSLETKMVRLYQRQMKVCNFAGMFPKVENTIVDETGKQNQNIEKDRSINKMKGLLYGYYIGANLSTTKEFVNKLSVLREIQNIFSSVISSYDHTLSKVQYERLGELFSILERQLPVYVDLEKEFGNRVDIIMEILNRHGYVLQNIDRDALIKGLESDSELNPSLNWVKREIQTLCKTINSKERLLSPDAEEIIVSADSLMSQKIVADDTMDRLLKSWVNNVFGSQKYNGKINSIKEPLSDDITTMAKSVIGDAWEESPVRAYLNKLRRHVRGEEFDEILDNGLLSSIAAVLSKGEDWEQLLMFMQSKGMYDYRIAFAIYGVLNGFANLTRDFTDKLLNTEYSYLSVVYKEFYGLLHEKSIQEKERVVSDIEASTKIIPQDERSEAEMWRDGIRQFARSSIKKNKTKLFASLENAFVENGENTDYFKFITMLNDFEGWGTSKGPSASWKRMQEHFCPDYLEKTKISNKSHQGTEHSHSLFDDIDNAQAYPKDISLLEDKEWILYCSSFINDYKAKKQFCDDMEWFIGNHNKTYNDKKKGVVTGFYYNHDTSNARTLERLKTYMENKLKPKSDNMKWLADIYKNIPITPIIDYMYRRYGK